MAYSAADPIRFQVVSQSPHTFSYKLWVGRPSDPDWQTLDQGDITTPPKEFGPYPVGTKLDYYLLIGGNPLTDWQCQVLVEQGGAPIAASPPPERGRTNSDGVADRETVVTLG